MAKFICPRCKAENITEHAGQGCALCGYGRSTSIEPPPSAPRLPQTNEAVCHECNQSQSKCGGVHYLRG